MKKSEIIILKAFLYAITQAAEELPFSLMFGIHQVVKNWDSGDEKAWVALEELLYNYDEILPAYHQACVTLQQRTQPPAPDASTATGGISGSELPNFKTVAFAILRAENPQNAAKRKLEEFAASPEWYLDLPVES